MKIKLGTVGHFCLAVRDPEKMARWWSSITDLKKWFSFPDGVLITNKYIAIALIKGKPSPKTIEHLSFHLRSMRELRAALEQLKRKKVEIEDPGDEIGPEAPGSRNVGLWFHDPDGYRWELSVLAKR
jgi:catechol 2,3-dioxygenase-like lactoylglutathione lyase family enzyme